MEKGFAFFSEGKFYRYTTSIDNSELPQDDKPPLRPIENPNDMVRGFTVYNISMMERDPETSNIVIRNLTQCDFKSPIPSFMITSFLPKATKQYYENICKYYNKNHKKL